MSDFVLEVQNLVTTFRTDEGLLTALDQVSFSIPKGRTLGVVGESGSGKSVTSLSIMGLLPKGVGQVASGAILFDGKDLLQNSDNEMQKIRGHKISMIFQEPMTALNPVFTVGEQIREVLINHRGMSQSDATAATLAMMKKVRISDPEQRIDEYPHQMSGGMKQRVVIAMALACEPSLIIADEPTTALDVTIQRQILSLMSDLQQETGTAIMLVTHDLGVIAEMADEVVVMYAGQVVESADVASLFDRPKHPYTQGLLHSIPKSDQSKSEPLPAIKGLVPSLRNMPKGCRFQERCPHKIDICKREVPKLRSLTNAHKVACHIVDGGPK
jgi:oligopeptide/dipeptide ABC transporter ATP-binding protein